MNTILILSDSHALALMPSIRKRYAITEISFSLEKKEIINRAAEVNPCIIFIGSYAQNEKRIELCQALRNYPAFGNTPILFLVENEDDEKIKQKASDAGIDAFFSVKMSEPELTALLKTIEKISNSAKINFKSKTEKECNEIESRYQHIVDYSTSIVLEWDTEGKILFMNNFGLDFFGFSLEEILGQNVMGTIVQAVDSSGVNLEDKMQIVQKHPEEFYSSENENICKNGRKVWVAWTNKGIYNSDGKLLKTLSIGIDRTQQHQLEKELKNYTIHLQEIVDSRTQELTRINRKLRESESRFRSVSENSLTGIYIVENEKFEYVNQALCNMFGYEADELIGQNPSMIIHPDDRQTLYKNMKRRISGEIDSLKWEVLGVCKNGEIKNILVLGGTIIKDNRRILLGNVLDITENKRNADKIVKTNRLYSVISQVNQAIVYIKDKELLFRKICEIAVTYGKFRMAWIGLVEEQTQTIKPYTFAGFEDNYLSIIKPISVGDVPEGRGPTGSAIREGNFFICQNFENNPLVEPWREEALKRDYHSSIAIPIKQSGRIIGAFTLYASTPDFFDTHEIELIDEVAGNINFALDRIKLEQNHKRAERELANKEKQFRLLFENMPSGYILFEVLFDENGIPYDHRLIEANKEFEPQTGLKREEEIGRISSELSFKWPEEVTLRFYQVATTGDSFSFQRYNESLKRHYDVRVSSPQKGQFALLFNDITESKHAQEKLVESQTVLRAIIDSTNDMIWSVDSENFGLLNWNLALENYFLSSRNIKIKKGYRPEELFPADSPFIDHWKQFYRNALAFGTFTTEYSTFSNKQTLLLTLNCLKESDTTFGISVFAKDITQIRAAEAEAIRNRKHFQTMFEEAPLGMALIDTQSGNILEANTMFAKITGRTIKELQKTNWIKMTYPEDVQIGVSENDRLRSREISGFNLVKRYVKPDGKIIWANVTVAAILHEANKTIRHIAMIEDITERKANEEKVMVLSKAIEQSPVSIIITDLGGNIVFVNNEFLSKTGYSEDEVIGKNPRILKPKTKSTTDYEYLWKTITSGNIWHGEFLNVKKNGEYFYESASITPLFDDKGKIIQFLAIKEDITERKKANALINVLSTAIEEIPLMVLLANENCCIEYVNRQFTSFTQYSLVDIKNKIPWVFNPKHWSKETHNDMWNTLNKGNVWQIEAKNRKKDGTAFWEKVKIFPLNDIENHTTKYIIVKEDITNEKQMFDELFAAKERAEESDRLKSSFLANMSHEIRTPLNSIIGFSELLSDPFFDPAQQTEFVNIIKKNGKNLLLIISDIMDISQIESGQITLKKEVLSANKLLESIASEQMINCQQKGLEFKISEPTGDLLLTSDFGRIKQILNNLMSNAIKFTEKGSIELGYQRISENLIQFYVKDTGIGIPLDFQEIIFERFRQVENSNTRKYGGNGLGLAIARQLAELLGGKITLESMPKRGSTFFLTMPVSE